MIFQAVGKNFIVAVVQDFYTRAFADPIIGHFFFGKDHDHITEQQITFLCAILGGPKEYQGRPIGLVHRTFDIRRPHFDRRQVLMKEVLTEHGLAADMIEKWLALENQFRPVIEKACPPRVKNSP